jgi:hypothetical protein
LLDQADHEDELDQVREAGGGDPRLPQLGKVSLWGGFVEFVGGYEGRAVII